MSKKPNNPIPSDPEDHSNYVEGQSDDVAGNKDISLDELEAQIKKAKPKPVKIEEPKKVEEILEPELVVEEELPEEFKGKTEAQLVEMYQNLRKLGDKQTNELGELRKGKKEAEDAVEMAKKYQLNEIAKTVIPQMKKWTPEEKQNWLAKLGDDPQATLTDFVTELMKPSLTTSADTKNRQAITDLKEKHKDAVVPYSEEEVNKILFYNPQMFKQYKSGAFEAAYNIYRDKNFPSFADKLVETKANQAKEEANAETEKKKGAFVEPVGVATPKNRGKIVNLKQQIEDMEDPDKALEVLEKLIPESDRK